jgi:hypothetical protein
MERINGEIRDREKTMRGQESEGSIESHLILESD